ncbi:vigilin-like [Ylistrum balloti]|uniref:vigilin-like n=1 Tax=Ylistrum balloti TaxID=509963 RepID=UPI002905F336|nr:vigilin-like [Ylistrum balloti]
MATNEEVVRNVDAEAYDPDKPQQYGEAFPPLAPAATFGAVGPNLNVAMEKTIWSNKMTMKTSTCTQVFTVPMEERRYKEFNEQSFGDETDQAKICKEIMARNNVSIEMSCAKDQSLTVVIHGKDQNVMKARREIVSRLQTQANTLLKIPREHHRFILGKSGKKLQELELATQTKITIPRPEENSDMIKITGTKEGIDKARHEIQITSDEQAKLAFERLPVPKVYHPFICGPKNDNIKKWIEETGAKIHMPPPSVMKDEIVVSGEVEGVLKCKANIMKIYEEKKRKCQTVSVEVRKSQHKYIIGPRGNGVHEILAATGVSVEVPPVDSSLETITLRGEQDKLGPALTMVYSKANSVVFAEVMAATWLHKYVIGRQGANVRRITEQFSKVHIEFTDGADKIIVEGPPEEVESAVKELEAVVKDLQSRMDFTEVNIDQRFHKHIIGKAGQNITRIKNDTGVSIKIPSDTEHSNIIRIEGDPKGVIQAKEELMEMAQRMENEKSKDILIEQRFHRSIIGARGENIREIRDRFNQVQITFPDPGKKSDIVTLRGPKNDVDKCFKHLSQLQQDMVASNYQAHVHIFKDFHKNVIGKGGATIRKIREDTNTKIDLPSEDSESDVILITGKKADVEAARAQIEAIQKDLANIKEAVVTIPHKLHNSIIGAKGRLIRAIMEECGGVIIRFPSEGNVSDKVIIRGPTADVENAKSQLMELASEKQQSSFTAEVRAKPEYHRFLIGRGGTNIRKVREKTGARVIFPSSEDQDQELISIIGKKESVDMAKVELEGLIKNLDNIVEGEMNVDPKHHRHFVARRGEVLRQIAEQYGGVTVSFPRSGVKSDRVVIKGSKDCVEGAKKRIQEIVSDLDSQVTMDCVIQQHHHRTVMGTRGSNVQEITRNYDVGIKFPERPIANGDKENKDGGMVNGEVNGEMQNSSDQSPKKNDIIVITGKLENCEQAKEALLALVPITDEMTIRYDFHRFIIGQQGKDVRRMMKEYDVNISIPPAMDHCETVKVTGPPANVRRALAALSDRCEELEREMEDRELKSFQLTIEVDNSLHPKIIGRRGAVISKIRKDHDVNIQFPNRDDSAQNTITITGYEKATQAAKEDILKIVQEYEEMVTMECTVDHRVHPRIIGARGRNIRKLMEQFKVDVRFPRSESDHPDLIFITGAEEAVAECQDYLLNIEEEFLQDVIDQEAMRQLTQPPSRQVGGGKGQPESKHGFVVTGAPWHVVPDTTSVEEFPSFGAVTNPNPGHAWGPPAFGKK